MLSLLFLGHSDSYANSYTIEVFDSQFNLSINESKTQNVLCFIIIKGTHEHMSAVQFVYKLLLEQ